MSQDSGIAIVVAGVSAASAITAAVIAATSATRTRHVELQNKRLSELEGRIADRKAELYQQIINLLRVMVNPAEATAEFMSTFEDKAREYSTWIGVYGSDEAVAAYHAFMSGALSNPPPPLAIVFRLYADIVIAARRDLGYPDTQVRPDQLLNARSFSLYIQGIWPDVNMPLEDLYSKHGWKPPWDREPEAWNPRQAAGRPPESSSTPEETPASTS